MSKNRYAARTDSNQADIVKALRQIPSVSVSLGKDDILVGFGGKTFWYEIKNPNVSNLKGVVFESKKKPEQKKLAFR